MKYKILDTRSLMQISVIVENISAQEMETITCSIDHYNDRVFFDSDTMRNYDCQELERLILDTVRPQEVEAPLIPPEIFNKIYDLKSGNFTPSTKDML